MSLDDSDVDFWILLINPKTIPGFIVWLVIAVVLFFVVQQNKDECAAKPCAPGLTGKLLDHECLCVGKPLDVAPVSLPDLGQCHVATRKVAMLAIDHGFDCVETGVDAFRCCAPDEDMRKER